MRTLARVLAACLLLAPAALRAQAPWPIRAVIVATFEIGKDTGDTPGEFQLWVEREHLTEELRFPGGIHPLRTNPEHTVLGMLSGTTLVNATASTMALGLDPRFDLSHAYWLFQGIAGVDPRASSMGSAAWAKFVVGDVARVIDPREMPKEWPYGWFPTSAHAPNPPTTEAPTWHKSDLYPLNAAFVDWAYAQTKSLDLGDDPKVAAFRATYTDADQAPARRPPSVVIGDTFASDYYWHGRQMTRFAEDWVRLWSKGAGKFVTTEMEDSGFMEAMQRLDAAHRADLRRVLVLRTGSNFCEPPPGHDPVESLTAPYIGTRLALESNYKAGSTVLHKLLADWKSTRDTVPGS